MSGIDHSGVCNDISQVADTACSLISVIAYIARFNFVMQRRSLSTPILHYILCNHGKDRALGDSDTFFTSTCFPIVKSLQSRPFFFPGHTVTNSTPNAILYHDTADIQTHIVPLLGTSQITGTNNIAFG
jgi:hypothetical protein